MEGSFVNMDNMELIINENYMADLDIYDITIDSRSFGSAERYYKAKERFLHISPKLQFHTFMIDGQELFETVFDPMVLDSKAEYYKLMSRMNYL